MQLNWIYFVRSNDGTVFWRAELAHSLNTDQKKAAQEIIENLTPFNVPTLSKCLQLP